jgi:glycosyltransferase involved in cell wall biosynthesis
LLVSTGNMVGGMEQVVLGLTSELPSFGWDARPIFPGPTSPQFSDWAARQNVSVETDSAILPLAERRSLRAIAALQSLVARANTSLVNIHFGANYISWKDILGIRLGGESACVASVHMPWNWNEIEGGEEKRRATWLASHLVHRIVVASHAMRDILLEADLLEDKIVVIPCGARPPTRLPCREEARHRLGVAMDSFVVACAARLVPNKGITDLVEAIRELHRQEVRPVLLIAGDGPERERLEKQARAIAGAQVRFLGLMTDVSDVYAAANVFALPSHSEGFGLAFVEAAFHGIPSIGTQVGGIPMAINNGETGILVQPRSPAAVAQAIKLLHDTPTLCYRLGEAAQNRANSELTEARMAERYAHLFDDAVLSATSMRHSGWLKSNMARS